MAIWSLPPVHCHSSLRDQLLPPLPPSPWFSAPKTAATTPQTPQNHAFLRRGVRVAGMRGPSRAELCPAVLGTGLPVSPTTGGGTSWGAARTVQRSNGMGAGMTISASKWNAGCVRWSRTSPSSRSASSRPLAHKPPVWTFWRKEGEESLQKYGESLKRDRSGWLKKLWPWRSCLLLNFTVIIVIIIIFSFLSGVVCNLCLAT